MVIIGKFPAVAGALFEGGDGLPIVLGACFAAVFLLTAVVLGRRDRERKEQRLRARVHASARKTETDDEEEQSWVRRTAGHLGAALAEREGWSKSLDHRLEIAGWILKPGEFIGVTLMVAVGGFLVGSILTKNFVLSLVIGTLLAVVPFVRVNRAGRKRAEAMQEQLVDILMILVGSLRAGHSFLQALDAVAREISEPASQEFNRVVAEIRLGRPTTAAMEDLALRVGSEDFNWAVMAVNIQREVGGNLAEVLDTIAETMRERERVRRQVKVLSAEGRLSMYILMGLPIAVATYLVLLRPEYIGLLWQTRVGIVMLTAASGLMVVGYLWMKKLVRIDV